MHRILKPGGLFIPTYMGESHSEPLAGESWDEDRIGMNVLRHYQGWDRGGPMVLISDWWMREHWGRAFEVLDINHGPHLFNWPLLRKRDVEMTRRGARTSERRSTGAGRRVRHNLPAGSAGARDGAAEGEEHAEAERRPLRGDARRVRGLAELAGHPAAALGSAASSDGTRPSSVQSRRRRVRTTWCMSSVSSATSSRSNRSDHRSLTYGRLIDRLAVVHLAALELRMAGIGRVGREQVLAGARTRPAGPRRRLEQELRPSSWPIR